MNNKQYLTALEKALSGLDKASRNDIVKEIQSHATESGDTLWERFGAPEELAQQYLEGEVMAKPLGSKIWGISKKLFIAIGILVVSLVLLAVLIFWWLRLDTFDYADENATELNPNDASWVTEEWADRLDIELDQASLVFYWHGEMTLRHNCKSQLPPKIDNTTITFNRSKCIVYLPKVPTTINAFQSQFVIVRPQQSLDIELKQAELKIAENGTSYRYNVDATRTNVGDLSSVEDAEMAITIKSTEASITHYSY